MFSESTTMGAPRHLLPEAASLLLGLLRGPQRPDLLREETLPEVFTTTAQLFPGHTALLWEDRQISYEELETASRIVAAALVKHGAKAGQVIGLILPRGADLLVAQLAITFSGAAWLPFDAETPLERVRLCLKSAGASGLVTCRACLAHFSDLPVPVWAVEILREETCEPLGALTAQPDDPAYVIYTSGSTGTPKGIVISHRNICHLLRSENELLGVRCGDRVYQGFSVAFDMSLEEIWISYLVGATLWIAPPQMVADPEALTEALVREQISVLHAVPTLMSLLEHPLPRVRLINLGGEACPDVLGQRLLRPGRQVFNSYGPTEASVTASLLELRKGEPVTIGTPLPNYGMLVLDEHQRPLPVGTVGELAIFGPGLALGYLGLPELTAQKFIANPVAASSAESRLYLTGDLGKIETDGSVHCLGRVDHQVKIRGFRVELDEIAAALQAQPGVATAAVVMRPVDGNDELIAFIVTTMGSHLDLSALRPALLALLPRYMVPAHLHVLPSLPRLTSGKVDLHALRAHPIAIKTPTQEETSAPRNEEEAILFAALAVLFPGHALHHKADFFDDLGGHSLLVARLVSLVRKDLRYGALGVQDVYRERRLYKIATVMALLRLQQKAPARPISHTSAPASRRWLCGLVQALVVPLFITLNIADWLSPFLVYHYYTGDATDSVSLAIAYALGVFVFARLLNVAIAIVGKRFVVGRLRAGRYPLWGVTYFRWWLAERFAELPDVYLITSTPWMPVYVRAMGARVGKDVMIDTLSVGAFDLLTIEDGVSLGTLVTIENARVEGGELILGPVLLKRESTAESYSVLENDTEVGAFAHLCAMSALGAGKKIPAGEMWDGTPARKTSRVLAPLPPRPSVSLLQHSAMACLFAISAILVSVLFFLPAFPSFMLIDWVDTHVWDIFEASPNPVVAFSYIFLLALPASAVFIIATVVITAGLRYLLPCQKVGRFSTTSLAFWHKKFLGQVMDGSLHELHGLYASVFAPLWMRCLGAKVGRDAEISTAEGVVPELLTLGSDCFIADGVILGDEEQRGGGMILQATVVGNRSFIGNGAYVPDGSNLPDDVLIGVQTRLPANEQMKPNQTWMGSPPILLPAREQITGVPENLTFRPSLYRRLGRAAVEILRILIPPAFATAAGYSMVLFMLPVVETSGFSLWTLATFALCGCAYGLSSFLFVVVAKWLLIGRYSPRSAPMWTPFVWISEAVTNLYESLAVPALLNGLRGTPILPWALRLLGTHIGRGVFLNTTDITEFDCVHLGDECELNTHCGPQTHLFEDRVMKIGIITIGARVTVGSRSIILYDTNLGDDVRLGPLTLVAKGETLPPCTRWTGSPASPDS